MPASVALDGKHYCGKHSDGMPGSILTCEYVAPELPAWRWQCPGCRIKDLEGKQCDAVVTSAESPASAPPVPHGTGQTPPSDGADPTLVGCLLALIQRLDVLIDQNVELIDLILSESGEEEERPAGMYLSGKRDS